ncbi:MAG: P1 family peptidase [Lachnospiraceae bacterium]|nr:P1 family peptidase [Lachnospiraceae bacterium]
MDKIQINQLTDFMLGQAQDLNAMTGCTCVIAPEGAVCGVDVRGGSPGTRDISALDPTCNRTEVHGVMLSGGSSFGLDAAGGLMEFLEEKKIGRNVGVTVVPNVCEAILFDLHCGSYQIRPDKAMGRLSGENAFSGEPFQSGNFGAGTGATIGKTNGLKNAMKGGVGVAAFQQGELMVGAVFAVNAAGDVTEDGKILAGALTEDHTSFADSEALLLGSYAVNDDLFAGNTVIGCIFTNGRLSKAQATRIAGRGQDGIAKVIRPAHSIFDGDTVFVMASGKVDTTIDAIGVLAEHATMAAITDAIKSAESYGCFTSYKDL